MTPAENIGGVGDWPLWRLEAWAAVEARWYRGGYMRPSLLAEAVWHGVNYGAKA